MSKHIMNVALMAAASGPALSRGMVSTVRNDAGSPETLVRNLNQAFEQFQATMNQRLTDADTLLNEKEERLQNTISDLQLQLDQMTEAQANIGAGGSEAATQEQREYETAFSNFMRNGDESGVQAARINNAMSVGTDEDGGFLAPVEWDRSITDALVEISPMRQYATVANATGQGFRRIYNVRGTASGWVGESADRDETGTPTLKAYDFAFGEIYANPGITARLLQDADFDIGAWLEDEVNTEFAYQEGVAFISGDGVNKPRGILTFDATTENALAVDKRHPLGPVSEVNTEAAADLSVDGILDLASDLPAERSGGAGYYANRKTIGRVRKMKDSEGRPIWQPSLEAGTPANLNGHACRELSGMPDIAANAIPLIFGNVANGYRVFDRAGTFVLRDPYTKKPNVLFYTTKRVGGGVWDPSWLRYQRVKVTP